MNAGKTITKFTVNIILTIAIIFLFLISLLSSTILNKDYFIEKIEETNYYNTVYQYVKSNFENYIHQSGFEETVLDDIVSFEKVKQDTKTIIDNLYSATKIKIDTQEIRDNLNKNIEATLEDKQINATQKEAINTFINYICDEYTDTLLHFNFENDINQYYQKVIEYISIAKRIMTITIVISISLLYVLNLKNFYKFISAIAISLIATGMLLVIAYSFIHAEIKIQTILVLNDAISIIIRNIITEMLSEITNGGYIFILVGICLAFLSNLTHYVKEKGR